MNTLSSRGLAGPFLFVVLFGQQVSGAQPAMAPTPAPLVVSEPATWDTASVREEERYVYAPLISKLFAPDNDLLDAQGKYVMPRRLDQDGDSIADADAVTILDLNQDGELDERDLNVWQYRLQAVDDMPAPVDLDGDGLITEGDLKDMHIVRVLGRDTFAEYDPTLDIDGNGQVNRLDFDLLTCEIARYRARSGSALSWNGEPVDPNSAPVHFDGVAVVWATPEEVRYLAEINTSAPAGPVPASFGEQGFWSDPPVAPSAPSIPPGPGGDPPSGCPSITRDTGWPLTPIPIPREWQEQHITWCFPPAIPTSLWYECTASATPGFHNTVSSHLACGIYEMDFSYQSCRTTESEVSVEAGAEIDEIVNLSVTWGASTSDAICWTVTPHWSKLNTAYEDCDVTYHIRFLQWTVSVTRTLLPIVLPGVCVEFVKSSETDVIKTPSSQTRTISTCWCGCPIEPED